MTANATVSHGAGGGEHSMLVSLDRASLQKTLKDVIDQGKLHSIAKNVIIPGAYSVTRSNSVTKGFFRSWGLR
jgi:hypothetical protein